MPALTRGWILAGLIIAASVAAKGDEWKKEYSVSGTPEVRVETNDAQIQVSSTDASTVQLRVTTNGIEIAPNKVRITERQNGNRVELEVHLPSNMHFITFHSTSRRVLIEATVPRQTNLNLHTGDGRVRVDRVKGELRIATGDGRIEGEDLDGALDANSGDGRIEVRGRFDRLHLHSGDGRIQAEALAGSKMAGSWSVSSGDGSVRLILPDGFAADLDAHTGDGHITFNIPVTVSGSLSRSTLRGKMNGGGEYLEIRTGDGNITVDKM
jgi:DUF4097 and DUF4098 domain-containing protein YvlB